MTINLRDFFYWFDKGRNVNQNAAVDLLLEQLPISLKRDDAAWVQLYGNRYAFLWRRCPRRQST